MVTQPFGDARWPEASQGGGSQFGHGGKHALLFLHMTVQRLDVHVGAPLLLEPHQIGRASCRERVYSSV